MVVAEYKLSDAGIVVSRELPILDEGESMVIPPEISTRQK